MIQTHGHGILKSSFSSLCLIVGVGFISRVLVVLEKPIIKVLRYHFCEVPFKLAAIFVKVVFLIRVVPFL